MARPFSTGPAHIYVGLPSRYTLRASSTSGAVRPGADPGTDFRTVDEYRPPSRTQPPPVLSEPPQPPPGAPPLREGLVDGSGGGVSHIGGDPEYADGSWSPIKITYPVKRKGRLNIPGEQADKIDEGETTVTERQVTEIKPYYLGTCEESPLVDLEPHYFTLYTDALGGYIGPGEDDIYLGDTATIRADINRWNEHVYAAIASRPAPASGRGAAGEREIGALMVGEKWAYPVWIYFPYWSKPIPPPLPAFGGGVGIAVGLAQAVMPPGYKFLSSYLIAPERMYPLGTRPRKISLVWRARYERQRDGFVRDKLVLYNHDMNGLPPPD